MILLQSSASTVPTPAGPRFPLAAHAPEEVMTWLRKEAKPLGSARAQDGAMQSLLREIVGSARVVGFGESAHGAHELFRLKAEAYQFLASQLGFSVFAIEAGFAESLAVNDYVLRGAKKAEAALAGLQVWSYAELLDLIKWMRAYNADPRHTRKLHFYGFDIQTSAAALERLMAYFRRVDPRYAASVESKAYESRLWASRTPAEFAIQPEGIRGSADSLSNELLGRLERRKDQYVARSTPDDWAIASRCATVLKQYRANLRAPTAGQRDRSMADNVRWILNHEGADARMMLWAHNGHLATGRRTYEYTPMGSYLRAALGSEYSVAGLFFDQGTIWALNGSGRAGPADVKPSRQGSLEATIARLGRETRGVDFRRLPPAGIVRDWFSSKRWVRSIGGMYSGGAALLDDYPAESYDAAIFVARVKAATPLPRRVSAPSAGLGRVPENLDFSKHSTGDSPAGWTLAGNYELNGGGALFVGRISTTECRAAPCVVLSGTALPSSYGTIMQSFRAAPFRGRRVVFGALVRADVLPESRAGLWLRIDRETDVASFDARRITDHRWADYEVSAEVPNDADVINVGVLLLGSGHAVVDDVRFEADGRTPRAPKPSN